MKVSIKQGEIGNKFVKIFDVLSIFHTSFYIRIGVLMFLIE